MSITYKVDKSVTVSGRTEIARTTIEAAAKLSLSENVGAGASGDPYQLGVPITECKLLWIQCSVGIVINVNSSGAPEATITLAAGQVYQWDSLANIPLQFGATALSGLTAATITTLFITNSDQIEAGTLKLEILWDPTP